MPLTAPNLDDRTFEDLLLEARLRIPRYTPEWTDFNDSDPGMTLVQLFAWFTELMLYRLNQVPDRNYIKFLKLLNLELRPAQPATVHVTFQPDGFPPPASIAAGSQVAAGAGPDGRPVVFETTRAIDLVPYALGDVQVFDGADFQVVSAANGRNDKTFSPFGWQPQPGNALYLGFHPPDNADLTVPVAFPQRVRLRVFLPPAPPAGSQVSYDGTPTARMPQVTPAWEYRSVADPTTWRPLRAFDDETAVFTREGYLEIEGPADAVATTEGKVQGQGNERYWVRARLASGTFSPDQVPLIAFVRTNTVEATNRLTVLDEQIDGETDGHTRQYALANRPVDRASLKLVSQPKPTTSPEQTWTRVDDFLASTRDDAHYVLDAANGTISFGNGVRGRIPEPGSQLIARTYRYGGGAAGNVRTGAVVSAPPNVVNVKVTNERPAVGGQDEENLDDLKERAPRYLRSRGRAVTAEDFRLAAEDVPGVIKATVLPLRLPEYPGVEVPGAVTVVIVPDVPPTSPGPRPRPSQDLLELTFARLDAIRLVTTELRVTEPRFRDVEVEVDLEIDENASQAEVKQLVEKAIRDFLSPVPVPAPPAPPAAQGTVPVAAPPRPAPGWPFGQQLYRSDLYVRVLGVTDDQGAKPVDAVSRLVLRIDGVEVDDVHTKATFADDQLPSCGAVTVNVPTPGGP